MTCGRHVVEADYIVVANETSEHLAVLQQLERAGFKGMALVEKPLVAHGTVDHPYRFSFPIYVGYNLRFHPLIEALSERLKGERVLTAQAYVGQYLPTWRPQRSHLTSYSAHKHLGGGVMRDLSHELDYMFHLFGAWQEATCLGGRYGNVTVDTEDAISFLIRTECCDHMTIHLNYLNQQPERKIIVNTLTATFVVDFIQQTLQVNGEVVYETQLMRNDTYRALHIHLLNQVEQQRAATFEDGMVIAQFIDQMDRLLDVRGWIRNE